MPEHTIAENLSRLVTAKTDIANAITTMGGVVGENDGFEEFPADILGIPSSSSVWDNVGSYNIWFGGSSKISDNYHRYTNSRHMYPTTSITSPNDDIESPIYLPTFGEYAILYLPIGYTTLHKANASEGDSVPLSFSMFGYTASVIDVCDKFTTVFDPVSAHVAGYENGDYFIVDPDNKPTIERFISSQGSSTKIAYITVTIPCIAMRSVTTSTKIPGNAITMILKFKENPV